VRSCWIGLLALTGVLLGPTKAWAALKLVATTPTLGMLAREVSGPSNKVSVLTSPNENVHQVQARPSIMAALRNADLLLAVGADLEAAWLAPAVAGAANGLLRPGRPGYFEAASEVTLIDAGKPADRRLGDVHPHGNPHVTMDPIRVGKLAVALARHLSSLDSANRSAYAQRGLALQKRLSAFTGELVRQVPPGVSAVLYHPDGDYLLRRLGIPILGYVEPLAGIPPTPRHLTALVGKISQARGVIFHAPYHPSDGPRLLASSPGWIVAMRPIEPGSDTQIDQYVALLQSWVDAFKNNN